MLFFFFFLQVVNDMVVILETLKMWEVFLVGKQALAVFMNSELGSKSG